MKMTERALNRATLARQLLLAREPGLDAVEAVRRVVALQAQQPASPYIALWNRLTAFDARALDEALADHRTVRATLMRITVHLVHADDYAPFREAMDPTLRASRLGDTRFTSSGLTAADADTLLPSLLRYASTPRTAAELRTWLDDELPNRPGTPLAPLAADAHRMLRHYAPLWHAPTGGPWSFDTRQSYVSPPHPPRLTDSESAAKGLRTLLHRYLEAFGPATVADMAQFTLIQRARIRPVVQEMLANAEVEQLPPATGKTPLYDIPDAPRPPENTPAPPRLLPMWDSPLLAYADRSRLIPPAYRKHVTRMNGDVLPTLLVDGQVAGVWRVVDDAASIEATAFHPLPAAVWRALGEEAEALTTFLAGRDARPYRRYDHWWGKGFPGGEVRRLSEG
ncbi:hypothetical protein SGFS_048080 [Streptomyces graminofaciens]|uniref:Winged helix DNA-binding domain-containing protein n=1 Tax=Streptomyces graminofaciens TaxID=68212 RepID=A0ABN5VJD1_9ACTN|nr:winged helix DNA-binding domain-containing protein [Streptomyces graminofaciens]BBC33514.1 hypothetical protein SGFS_048080 [Streptomyces graminofaciens]